MELTTLEDYVRREVFKTDKELFDFCPSCDETGNTIRALMEGLFIHCLLYTSPSPRD